MSWSNYLRLWWCAVLGAAAYGALIAAVRPPLAEVLLIGGGLAAQGAVFRWLLSEPRTSRRAMPDLTASTTAQLCSVWAVTYRALQRTEDAGTRQALVQLRADCLDELERRHPDDFLHWLADARPDRDPTPFFPPTASRPAGYRP